MRPIKLIFIYLFLASCSQDKNSIKNGSNTDTISSYDKILFYPDTQKRQQFECGTSVLVEQLGQKLKWISSYKDQFICADYVIKKDSIIKLLTRFNTLDSFKITDISNFSVGWIDDRPLKAPDTLKQSSYVWVGVIPEQIFTIKKTNGDSIPLKISFSIKANGIGAPKTIIMSICSDTLISKRILKIITDGRIAKQKR